MNPRLKAAACCLASALLFLPLFVSSRGGAQNLEAVTRQAWTLDEAVAALSLQPRDAYLQYVVLQLARRAGRFDEVEPRVRALVGGEADARAQRRRGADLFGLFTGALAVQESLQLDAMRSVTPARAPTPGTVGNVNARNMNANMATPPPARGRRRTRQRRGQARAPRPAADANAPGNLNADDERFIAALEGREPAQAERPRDTRPVQVSTLSGPTIKSHPWEKMLAGRRPDISALARAVPEDFYFAEFRALTRLLDAFEAGDLWGSHLSNQAFRDTATLDVGERLKRQLAVETDPRTRPFYDLVVEEVAVTGSDPFVREGSDVTLLFRVRQPLLFRERMDGFIDAAARARADARRETGEYLGVEYVQLQTPERDVSVVSAYPEEGLHIRSNSLTAFRRIVEAVKGKDSAGRAVRRLGDNSEFAYIRTLMPRGDAREDGFVYLSDPFIRRLMGPVVKLTERRRLLCYNHLRMTGHAALLFRTERGRAPSSLRELKDSGAAPGLFGEGVLACPDGGRYALSVAGTAGVCSHHGHALRLTPNIEAPVAQVTHDEAEEYKAFLAEYNQYWRTFFDPIAFRLKVAPEELRIETVVLPLIDNTAYTALARALGGAPEPLDALPVPRRNIFSAGLRFNKEELLREMRADAARRGPAADDEFLDLPFGFPGGRAAREKTFGLLSKGLGNQWAFHLYDSRPPFELNVPSLLGVAAASGAGRGVGGDVLGLGPFFTLALLSLNSPVYLSFPVADEKVVDDYLDWSDAALSHAARNGRRGRWVEFEYDFYKYKLATGEQARAFGLRFDPARLNFYWARIGRGVYVATKPFILEDLAALQAQGQPAVGPAVNEDLSGHGLARVRAGNWDEVLPGYNLSWAENEREACLNNLGPLASAARALTAVPAGVQAPSGEALDRATVELAERLAGARFVCPEAGAYRVSADGRQVACGVHGTAADPRQPAAPSDQSPAGRTMRRLSDLTATLTFMDDGLHAVLVVKRR